ncbi:MAG: lipase family protein [Pyrinomonadaceae bacterium]
MKKPIPPARYSQIRPPNENYTYFEDNDHCPFVPRTDTFELVNAGWLSDFALVAYGDENFVRDKFQRSGLTAAGFQSNFFSGDTTQCFVAHNDQLAVLAFRGTEIDNFVGAFEDWMGNFDFAQVDDESGGRVHRGFRKDLAEVWADQSGGKGLKTYLGEVLANSTRTLWITGHSLGAALATLAAERCVRDGGFRVNGVYTFGSPRVGGSRFKQEYDAKGLGSRTYRFVNNVDVCPRIPPGDDYTHVGQLKFIGPDGRLQEDITSNPHSGLPLPETTSAQQRSVRISNLLGTRIGSMLEKILTPAIPAPFANHAPIYYASHVWNNL